MNLNLNRSNAHLPTLFCVSLGEITPFEFFRQEASNVDVVIRTEAMMKITIVVSLMGPDNTREEMIPFLQCKSRSQSQYAHFKVPCILHID